MDRSNHSSRSTPGLPPSRNDHNTRDRRVGYGMSTQMRSSPVSTAEPLNRNVIVPAVGSPEFFRDPYPTYRSLREQGPLVSLRPNVLACTRYHDCLALLRDPRFSARRY